MADTRSSRGRCDPGQVVIVVGLIVVALLILAFAGGALREDDDTGPSGAWSLVLFLALLLGIVLRKQKARDEDEF